MAAPGYGGPSIQAHKKDFDRLLYGLTDPLSPTAKPAPEIRLPVQVRPHLVQRVAKSVP